LNGWNLASPCFDSKGESNPVSYLGVTIFLLQLHENGKDPKPVTTGAKRETSFEPFPWLRMSQHNRKHDRPERLCGIGSLEFEATRDISNSLQKPSSLSMKEGGLGAAPLFNEAASVFHFINSISAPSLMVRPTTRPYHPFFRHDSERHQSVCLRATKINVVI
jgi:hypothetical protein